MKEQQSANTVSELPSLVDFVNKFFKDALRFCPRLDTSEPEEINTILLLLLTPSFGVLRGSGGHLFCCYVEIFAFFSPFDRDLLREITYSD